MPSKGLAESKDTPSEGCILQYGKDNNVVEWKEDMQNISCGLYGMTGIFFSTNKSYVHPFPREEDYNPTFVQPIPQNEGDDEEDDEEEDDEGEDETPPTVAVPPAADITEALIAKL
jgi:hypothetical protein